jgi:hypothetical protein
MLLSAYLDMALFTVIGRVWETGLKIPRKLYVLLAIALKCL